jgi:acetyltransferase
MRTALFGLFGLHTAITRPVVARPLAAAVPAQTPACQRSVRWTTACGTELTLRPVHPEDAALLGELFEEGLSRDARYSRFHGAVGRLSATRLAWMADADFQRHAAFVVTRHVDGLEHAVAEGRWVRTAVNPGAEFALCVADAWQGRGIGRQLLRALVRAGQEQGLPCLQGDVMPSNGAMQAVARSLGFDCAPHPEETSLVRAERSLVTARKPAGFFNASWLH